MDWKEETKLKFGNRLLELLKEYGWRHKQGKASLRGLAARSGLEYSHVQRISKGQVDVSLTTVVSLSVGLELSPKDLMDF